MRSASDYLTQETFNQNRTPESGARAIAQAFLTGQMSAGDVQLEAAKIALTRQQLHKLQMEDEKAVREQEALNASLEGFQNAFSSTAGGGSPVEGVRASPDAIGPIPGSKTSNAMAAFQTPQGQAALTNAALNYIRAGKKPDEAGDLFRTLAGISSSSQAANFDDLIIAGRNAAGNAPIGVNDAFSTEGQNRIYQRNLSGDLAKERFKDGLKEPDLKKNIENRVLETLLSGEKLDPNLKNAFDATHSSRTTKVTSSDGTTLEILDGLGGNLGRPSNGVSNDLQNTAISEAEILGQIDSLIPKLNASNTGVMAALKTGAPARIAGQFSQLSGVPVDQAIGVGPDTRREISNLRSDSRSLIATAMPLLAKPPYSDREFKYAEETIGLIDDPTVDEATIKGRIEGIRDMIKQKQISRGAVIRRVQPGGGDQRDNLLKKFKSRGLILDE